MVLEWRVDAHSLVVMQSSVSMCEGYESPEYECVYEAGQSRGGVGVHSQVGAHRGSCGGCGYESLWQGFEYRDEEHMKCVRVVTGTQAAGWMAEACLRVGGQRGALAGV